MSARLAAGFDLWGLVERDSFIFRRLDWLTKFKLTQTLDRARHPVPAEIAAIAQKCDWPELLRPYPFGSGKTPTLIETSLLLPTRGILFYEIGPKSPLENWSELQNVLKNLRTGPVRFFIPRSYQVPKSVVEEWGGHGVQLELFDESLTTDTWNWL